jgi:hypothetical protein
MVSASTSACAPERRRADLLPAVQSPSHASDHSFSSVSEHEDEKMLAEDPAVQGHERMTAFFDEVSLLGAELQIRPRPLTTSPDTHTQVSKAHISLDHLKSLFDQTRALGKRLRVLHPNSLDTPFLALELRDHLKAASHYLIELEEAIHATYEKERETRVFVKLGRVQIGDEDLWETKEETDGLVARFLRRIKKIKREARGEKRDRKKEAERHEPPALDDWLACEGIGEVQVSLLDPRATMRLMSSTL